MAMNSMIAMNGTVTVYTVRLPECFRRQSQSDIDSTMIPNATVGDYGLRCVGAIAQPVE